LTRHREAPSSTAGMAGSGKNPWQHGWARCHGEEGDKTDGRGVEDGRCKPKRKTYFERTPRARGPDGLTKQSGGLRARRASSGELGRITVEDSSKFCFSNFKDF
jgi:hypothetical protein